MSLLEVSRIESYRLEDGRVRHRMELAHHGLNRHRIIRSDNPGIVERKAEIQITDWEERWEKLEARRSETERRRRKADEAAERAEEARRALERLRNTLAHTLDVDDTIRWDDLRDDRPFTKPRPPKPSIPREPRRDDASYDYELTVVDRLLPPRKKAKEEEARRRFEKDLAEWEALVDEREKAHEAAVREWTAERDAHERRREETNRAVEEQQRRYLARDPEAIVGYCDLVLSRSRYPDEFPQEFEVHYDPDTMTLVVDYRLPPPEAMPTLRDVRYSKSRDEFMVRHLKGPQVEELYDDVVYQITLRTIHEVYEADVVEALSTVVFNGHVQTVDRATGKEIDACLVSVRAGKDEFLDLRLSRIDPAKCFLALGGVQGAEPHEIVPVRPILSAEEGDVRPVDSA